jgi:hypothetical protein
MVENGTVSFICCQATAGLREPASGGKANSGCEASRASKEKDSFNAWRKKLYSKLHTITAYTIYITLCPDFSLPGKAKATFRSKGKDSRYR